MLALKNCVRVLIGRQVFEKTRVAGSFRGCGRTFADTPDVNSKQITVQGPENDERVRVRRARPADGPRVLRFVRENAGAAWPGLAEPPAAPQLMLCDYVARALAQGHSMLAEKQDSHRGMTQIRGIALGMAVCPWDASMLDKWARCMRCARSRRLMAFTAHCLRAPALHDKYRVHNVLQVILIVPQNNPKSAELIQLLAKNSMKRGREVGFPLIRFDVTGDVTAKSLEDLKLKKEWQLSYDVVPGVVKDVHTNNAASTQPNKIDKEKVNEKAKNTYKHRVAVYVALADSKQ